MTQRLPWEIVETLPSTDARTIDHWEQACSSAPSGPERVRSQIGLALSLYWAVQEGVADDFDAVAQRRQELTTDALATARALDDAELTVEALLGVLYATWGPDRLLHRDGILEELTRLRPRVTDEELCYRIDEWRVLDAFDHGDTVIAKRLVDEFSAGSAGTELLLFRRRAELWRSNLAMLRGDLDRALQINQEVIAATSDAAGTPFSFQNVAISVAIERFLRGGLADVVDPVRSIRASSPRVGTNWDVGLAFTLSEVGDLDGALDQYEPLASEGFRSIPRDLNWLVTMQLVGLIALTTDDRPRLRILYELLEPYAHLDATHGSGYASYGPVGRVVGSLAARLGAVEQAAAHFDHVLATRADGPWTALTVLDRASTLHAVDPDAALLHAGSAHDQLRSLGLTEWARRAASLVDDLEVAGHGGPVAHRSGATWHLRHPTGAASVADGVGIRHLVALLERPGSAIDVVDLDSPSAPMADAAGVHSTLDEPARRAYRRRVAELEGAPALDDEAAAAELDFLRRELAGAGFAPSVSREVERARVRVTKAIRRTMARVADQSPGLADHLTSSVETGRRCVYAPNDGRAWRVTA